MSYFRNTLNHYLNFVQTLFWYQNQLHGLTLYLSWLENYCTLKLSSDCLSPEFVYIIKKKSPGRINETWFHEKQKTLFKTSISKKLSEKFKFERIYFGVSTEILRFQSKYHISSSWEILLTAVITTVSWAETTKNDKHLEKAETRPNYYRRGATNQRQTVIFLIFNKFYIILRSSNSYLLFVSII